MGLPLILGVYLEWRRRFDDLLAVLAVSRDSARQLNDKDNEAAALNNLGVALRELRRFEEAVSAHQDAAAIYRETGDRQLEGIALRNIDADRAAEDEDGGRAPGPRPRHDPGHEPVL